MSSEINLLRSTKSTVSPLVGKLFAFRAFSLVLLFVISFFSITLFVLIALSPLPKLQQQEQTELQKIAFLHPKMAKIMLTRERLNQIQTILQTRPVYSELLQKVSSYIPTGADVDAVKLESGKINITVSSRSLADIEVFADGVTKSNSNKKFFSKVSQLGLFLNVETGRYVITLELTPAVTQLSQR